MRWHALLLSYLCISHTVAENPVIPISLCVGPRRSPSPYQSQGPRPNPQKGGGSGMYRTAKSCVMKVSSNLIHARFSVSFPRLFQDNIREQM